MRNPAPCKPENMCVRTQTANGRQSKDKTRHNDTDRPTSLNRGNGLPGSLHAHCQLTDTSMRFNQSMTAICLIHVCISESPGPMHSKGAKIIQDRQTETRNNGTKTESQAAVSIPRCTEREREGVKLRRKLLLPARVLCAPDR